MVRKSNHNQQIIQNSKTQELTYKFNVADEICQIRILDAPVGTLNEKDIILDKVPMSNMLKGIEKSIRGNHTKYNKVPKEVIIVHKEYEKDITADKASEKEVNEYKVVECFTPRFSLSQVVLNESIRKQLTTTLSAINNRKRLCDEWGMEEYFTKDRAIILNFHGAPGTGKSMTAEAIAHSLDQKVFSINYAELESKYVGETPKNIKKAFEKANEENAVLIFDEADSFLGKRLSSVTQSADYGVNITRSVLLMELERFNGVVIFTTNMLSNYDAAFKRRILSNIQFDLPDEKSRKLIWDIHINKKMPLSSDITTDELAKKYSGVSGADIKDIVFFAGIHAMELNSSIITFEMFDYAYKMIKQRYADNQSEIVEIKHEKISTEEFEQEMLRLE